MQSLTIVSRTSALAMWQAESVRSQLLHHHPELMVSILGIKTEGDRWLDTPLYEMGGKSLFVKELEQALIEGKADIAVHSLKDVPVVLVPGLDLGAFCQRDNPFDGWVSPKGLGILDLPPKSVVGTSSLRRIAQLTRLRPDLQYVPLRGNVDTRLKKCLAGEWDAIVLAVAGLTRLKLQDHITQIFTPEEMLPAVGQGALVVECRSDDLHTRELIRVLDHSPTRLCVKAERAMNAALGGSCQVAVAGLATILDNTLHLTGRVGDHLKGILLESQKSMALEDPVALGEMVAQDLIHQGALEVLARAGN